MSKLTHRSVNDGDTTDQSATLLGYASSASSTTALDQGPTLSEAELMAMPGNDFGLPLLIQYEKMGTLLRNLPNTLLENKGPVARDHLANERNYLAWVRTSLSFATIGLAVTQAFRGYGDGLLIAGKVIGALFIVLAIALLLIGTYRFYIVAIWVQRDKFPPSRASVLNVTIAAVTLIAIAFILIVINTSRAT